MKKTFFSKFVIIILWVVISIIIYKVATDKDNKLNQDINNQNENSSEQSKHSIENIQLNNIRVLIKTSHYESIYHDKVSVSGSNGLEVTSESGTVYFAPNDTYTVLTTNYKQTITSPNNGRITILDNDRNEVVAYRGSLEISECDKGLVVINELPLEEYLYGVVPSEMPSTYPMEALKAQAICARTYALYNAKDYAYPQWQAHVDDSTAFQVYMNTDENPNTIQAVDETKGVVLSYDNKIIESYYYSTSSGCQTGYEAWGKDEEVPYLQASSFSGNRKDFKDFIDNGVSSDIEFNEPWYRWKYSRNLDKNETKDFINHIYNVYKNNPDTVVISSNEINGFLDEDRIKSIEVTGRLKSGLVDELEITTDNYKVKVKTQHIIRQILAKKGGEVIKQDDSVFVMNEILPSSYFYLDTVSDGEKIINISIKGGGLGHGVGMSQNGAKCLADDGKSAQDILKYYYKNVDITKVI